MLSYFTTVHSGRGEGTKLGFPTLNLTIPPKFPPRPGIYAGYVWLDQKYPAVFHYGPVPLFNQSTFSLEAHLIGQTVNSANYPSVKFQLIKFLRPVKSFSQLDDLAKQIKKDCHQALNILE